MNNNYKIDRMRNIGNVIFVVEGGKPEGGTELRLLKSVFTDILGYEVQELRRGSEEFIGHGNNGKSRIFALNLPKNQLTQLTEDSIDLLFSRLKSEFRLKPEDCPIYFLYDRDYLSYKHNELRKNYVCKYTDPYANDNGYQGQLLLSYPSIESYILSCFQDDVFLKKFFLGKDVKPETKIQGITEEDISAEDHLINATIEMDKGLAAFGIHEYNLDNLEPILIGVYDEQQKSVLNDRAFSLLSLFSMALLELGVIYKIDDSDEV